ncbi:MAG: glycerate kinase [Ginsengibacter sp.]
MHILVAPNAFKNSLTAMQAAEAISAGLMQSKLRCTTNCFPVGDGGDGTAALLTDHFGGSIINTIVSDPLGRKIKSSFGLIENGKTAVIELANASGLKLLRPGEYDPLHANTYGTGELIGAALDQPVNKIILCIGGSATIDGGIGIMRALGAKFFNKEKTRIKIPAFLTELSSINMDEIDERLLNIEMIVLCDVENFLTGENGAALIFGPQKGAGEKDIVKLEAGMKKLNEVVLNQYGVDMSGVKHGGAAGGVAAGLHVLLRAELVNGIEYFLNTTGFDQALKDADLVITAEGSIDEQTLKGKGPLGVARRGKQMAKPVIGIAGNVPMLPSQHMQEYFDVLLPVNNQVADVDEVLKNTYQNLVRTAVSVGNLIAIRNPDK